MEGLKYFYELYEGLPRCGPGDNGSTRRAYSSMLDIPERPDILDIGCGTGIHTLELARVSRGKIIALDNHQPFLDRLVENAREEGLEDDVHALCQSMLEMEFEEESFDVIWSEGALYFMGFQNGLRKCHSLLKAGGYAAVSEAVYLRPDPPSAVVEFWKSEYPDISDIDGKIADVEKENFKLITHFTLPESAWLDAYYVPMEQRIVELGDKYRDNEEARSVLSDAEREIEFYRTYSSYYGYEFFVMHKPSR